MLPILLLSASQGELAITTIAEYIATKKVLFFDLFHTLTSLESEWSEIPPTCELLGVGRDELNKQLLGFSRDRLVGILRDPVEFLGKRAHALDPSIPDERIREAARLRSMRFASSLVDIPAENLATVAELRRRGARLCLISNADVSEAAAWSESPLARLFDDVLFHATWVRSNPSLKSTSWAWSTCARKQQTRPS